MRWFGIFCLIVIAVAVGVFLAIFAFENFSPTAVAEEIEEVKETEGTEGEISREEILASDPPGRYPILSGGAVTWQDAYVTALEWTAYKEALFIQRSAISWEELAEMAESGDYNTIYTLKKGTRIVNSYYRGDKIIFVEEVLKKDRLVLHNKRGEPAILVSCGNPIRVLPQKKVVVIPDPIIVVTPPPSTPPPGPPPPPPHCDPEGNPGPDPDGEGEPCPPSGGPGPDPD